MRNMKTIGRKGRKGQVERVVNKCLDDEGVRTTWLNGGIKKRGRMGLGLKTKEWNKKLKNHNIRPKTNRRKKEKKKKKIK